jgi:hypothetical protein
VRRLVEYGGDAEFMHRGEHYAGGAGGDRSDLRAEAATPLMAAVGMSRTGRAWVFQDFRSAEHQAEVLEKVKVLVEAGVDVNARTDAGLTALDAARDLEYHRVVEFLEGVGARTGEQLAEAMR